MSEKKELSDQTRAIIAAALSLIVIVGYSMFYKPAPPAPRTPNGTVAVGTTPGGSGATTAPSTTGSGNAPSGAPTMAAAVSAGGTAMPAVAAAAEQTIVVDSDLYHVEISNRGGVVHSWQLKKYTDSSTPPKPLDLINAAVAQQSGGWPMALLIPDAASESAANLGLYTVSVAPPDPVGAEAAGAKPQTISAATTTLTAPAELTLHWSDGHVDVTKRLKFDGTYVVELKTSVSRDGQPVEHRVAWNGGFGDVSAFREAVQTVVFTGNAGSVTTLATKKLGATGQPTVFAPTAGNFDSVGIEDLFFAASFLPPLPPPGQPIPAALTISTKQVEHDFNDAEGKAQQEFLPAMAAGQTTGGPLDMRIFVGPKDIDLLKSMRPPLNGLVNFGWFGFIAEPLFYSLRWTHRYISNYGWDIVLITIVINMLLYPLKVKSWRGMQKMQKAAPEIKQIQDRYKKYSVRDPRKAEMNKEVMAVYAREGINPVGSCIPQLVQMPIWLGLYRMLNSTLELRHAPWILWVHDLSGHDPYYILTILMGVSMFAAQKMTPMTATDPSQQRMMAIMPLMFVGMFLFIPVSSGLILYIFTQQIVAVGQQWHLNKSSPLKPPPGNNKLKKK